VGGLGGMRRWKVGCFHLVVPSQKASNEVNEDLRRMSDFVEEGGEGGVGGGVVGVGHNLEQQEDGEVTR
jgi:hypothetical protein